MKFKPVLISTRGNAVGMSLASFKNVTKSIGPLCILAVLLSLIMIRVDANFVL